MKDFKELINKYKDKIYAIADKNTSKNSKGVPCIKADDDWADEYEWDEEYTKQDFEESMREVQLIREGKLPRKTWDEFKKEMDSWVEEDNMDIENKLIEFGKKKVAEFNSIIKQQTDNRDGFLGQVIRTQINNVSVEVNLLCDIAELLGLDRDKYASDIHE